MPTGNGPAAYPRPRGKGCHKPDPEKVARHPLAADHEGVKASLAAPLPPSADKLPPRPRVDQGQSGSCTWGSFSVACACALEAKGTPLGFIPSQHDGYGNVRAFERATHTPLTAPLPPLTDSGAMIEDVLTVAASIGVQPMQCQTTPDGRFYDVWTDADTGGHPPGNVNDEPTLASLEADTHASVLIDAAAHYIAPSDPNASDLMAAALSASPPLPIYACGYVDTTFERLLAGHVAGPTNPADPNGGGHAFWFSAYRTNAAGQREWKLENSWGRSWADDGACWVSEEFIRQSVWVMYALDVSARRAA